MNRIDSSKLVVNASTMAREAVYQATQNPANCATLKQNITDFYKHIHNFSQITSLVFSGTTCPLYLNQETGLIESKDSGFRNIRLVKENIIVMRGICVKALLRSIFPVDQRDFFVHKMDKDGDIGINKIFNKIRSDKMRSLHDKAKHSKEKNKIKKNKQNTDKLTVDFQDLLNQRLKLIDEYKINYSKKDHKYPFDDVLNFIRTIESEMHDVFEQIIKMDPSRKEKLAFENWNEPEPLSPVEAISEVDVDNCEENNSPRPSSCSEWFCSFFENLWQGLVNIWHYICG